MRKRWVAVLLAALMLLACASGPALAEEAALLPDGATESPDGGETPPPATPTAATPTPTATASASPTPSPTPVATPTPTGTTAGSSPTPTLPQTSDGSPTPVLSVTPVLSGTPSPTPVLSPTPSLSPSPSPTPLKPYAVTIIAQDATIAVGDVFFSLRDLAYAVDEWGEELKVRIRDDGGFDVNVPGVYTVVFRAEHPVTDEDYTAECTVTVEEAPEPEPTSTLTGTSDSRYRKYLKYRDEVAGQLQCIMQELNEDFRQRIELLRGAFSDASTFEMLREVPAAEDTDTAQQLSDEQMTLEAMDAIAVANWSHILATFVAESSLDVDEPLDLFNLRKISLDGIGKVFWDMHELKFHVENGTLKVILKERSSEDMVALYNLDEDRQARLDELMQPEFQRLFASLTGDTAFVDMSGEEAQAIRTSLPTGLAMQRESVVLAAYSLVGQVKYFWGGKYPYVGWNSLWSVPRVVGSDGSKTTGTVRSYGLDCSGFVTWVFVNAAGDESVADAIGNGSANQWSKSLSLGWDEAQPGDLAFRASPGSTSTNHVGIVVAKREDGTYLVAHSSSSKNGVVVTEAWSSGFRYMRRPALYGDA